MAHNSLYTKVYTLTLLNLSKTHIFCQIKRIYLDQFSLFLVKITLRSLAASLTVRLRKDLICWLEHTLYTAGKVAS